MFVELIPKMVNNALRIGFISSIFILGSIGCSNTPELSSQGNSALQPSAIATKSLESPESQHNQTKTEPSPAIVKDRTTSPPLASNAKTAKTKVKAPATGKSWVTVSNGKWTITTGQHETWDGVNNTGDLTYYGCDSQGNCLSLTGGKVVCRDGVCKTFWKNGDYTYTMESPITDRDNTGSTVLVVIKNAKVILKETGFKIVEKSPKKVKKSDKGALGSSIFQETTEKELIEIYGRKNVKRAKIPVGEGETVLGTVLFPGTTDELTIEWKANFARPERITASQGKRWRTREGIAIGTTLEKVEQANQGSFKLSGFEWDYPGRTLSWEGGRLEASLQLELVPTEQVSPQEYQLVMGEGPYSSSLPVLKKMKLKVARIFVRW